MTTIDGTGQPGTLHGIPAATLARLDELARITARTPAELVAVAVSTFAPPVETRARALPGDGRAGSGEPPAPLPAVSYVSTRIYCGDCGEEGCHEVCS